MDSPPREPDDSLARAREGDEEAARALVERLHPLVMKIVRAHLPRRAAEEDLAQEVFARVFERLDQYEARAGVPFDHWVARLAVRLPLGQLGPLSFAAAVALGAAALLARGRGRPARTRLALLALVAVLLAPAIRLHTVEPAAQVDVAADAALWRSEGRALVVLGGRVREDDLLAGLRERGVDRLDVIVCRTPAASLVVVVRDLQRRYGRAVVLAPEGSPVVGAEPPPEGATVAVGGLLASIAVEPDRLTVVVEPSGGVDGGSV